eukprot:gene53394-64688_t
MLGERGAEIAALRVELDAARGGAEAACEAQVELAAATDRLRAAEGEGLDGQLAGVREELQAAQSARDGLQTQLSAAQQQLQAAQA